MENQPVQVPKIGIEIKLPSVEHFSMIRETLSRMGIASKKSKTLYQSCHVLHKQGRYFICSFKELFLLDHKDADISEDDYRRRNTITKLLVQWQLCTVVNKADLEFLIPISEIKIVPHKEKHEWGFITKYQIGNKKQIYGNHED